uniref:Uncharacterized protein n=1 Tax=Bionectria ochroleuca TaxID=29856 RepID=A0A0B7K5F2_BIOOC
MSIVWEYHVTLGWSCHPFSGQYWPLPIVNCPLLRGLRSSCSKCGCCRIRLAPSVAFSNTDATESTIQKILGCCLLLADAGG